MESHSNGGGSKCHASLEDVLGLGPKPKPKKLKAKEKQAHCGIIRLKSSNSNKSILGHESKPWNPGDLQIAGIAGWLIIPLAIW